MSAPHPRRLAGPVAASGIVPGTAPAACGHPNPWKPSR